MAFEEMAKHGRWEDTLRGSFAVFSSALHRTFFSADIGELLKHEKAVEILRKASAYFALAELDRRSKT